MIDMRVRYLAIVLLLVSVGVSTTLGQQVQLPTFSYTTVNTTVSVPDRGSAYLGGIKRSSSGRTSHGVPLLGKLPFFGRPFGNRAIGYAQGASHMHVTATIIDHQELDEAILGMAAARRAGTGKDLAAVRSRADYLARNLTRRDSQPLPAVAVQRSAPSAEDIRRRNELASKQRDKEAALFYEKGQKAAAAGKYNVAKIYYQMAARRAKGDFRAEVLARLDAVSGGNALKVAASR